MVRRIQRSAKCNRGQPVRTVLVVLPALVEHHVALVVELCRAQRGQQMPHAIGFHPERELERTRRDDFPVVRAVSVGRAVERGAGLLQGLEEPVVVVRRPFEHQVFEEMRESGAARPLVFGSNVVPQVHGHDWTRAIFVDQHVQAVGQRLFRDGKRDRGCV